jgi:hypothetical protein
MNEYGTLVECNTNEKTELPLRKMFHCLFVHHKSHKRLPWEDVSFNMNAYGGAEAWLHALFTSVLYEGELPTLPPYLPIRQ